MRRRLLVSLLILSAGLTVASTHAQPSAPPPQASFHGIGDLPTGGFVSAVRDATKVGGTIYAVGSGTGISASSSDTAVYWTWDGAVATLSALPNLATGTAAGSASAITRSGLYIAGQSRANGPAATRFAASSVSAGNTNPQQVVPNSQAGVFRLHDDLGGPGLVPNVSNRPQQAESISDDGNILYSAVNNFTRASRFDVSAGISTLIPLASPATGNLPAPRGMSSDGSVMVGTGFVTLAAAGVNSVYSGVYNGTVGRHAFRYVHASPVGTTTAIPKPAGGTWSKALALTTNGNLTLVAGNSTAAPNGEVYVHNASAGTLTALGSPNAAFLPTSWGGITADGAVAAVSFSLNGNFTGGDRFAYIHNGQGWFQLATVLAAAGVDIGAMGWTHLSIAGMSPDGTLVFGLGNHDGLTEGFIAEFAAGDLAAFDIQPAAPANTAIVGAWALGDVNSPEAVLAFLNDGTYFIAETEGIERGFYTWDGNNFTVATKVDTGGATGLSDLNGSSISISVVGDELRLPANCDPIDPECVILPRIVGNAGNIVGGWILGDPTMDDTSVLFVLTNSGKYFLAEDGPVESSGRDGNEVGFLTWVAPAGAFTPQLPLELDANGQWGFSNLSGPATAAMTADELQLTITDNAGSYPATRVVDPQTVVPQITSALTASGTATTAFSYTATATRALTFGATALPAGLSIEPATGVISGTPTTAGTFTAHLTATNTLSTGTADLEITIDPPNTATGSNVVVVPDLPPGAGSISLQFTAVIAAGETSVTTIPAGTGPATTPPAGFSLGEPPVYYDVDTTAQFSGPVTLCFSYAGVNVGGGTPRLFHFEGSWVDITTSVDTNTLTLCGSATSFSPFAVFVSPIVRTGFLAPVDAAPGTFNTVKGGSTVPLKFKVFVNGVEKTDTAGLVFSAFQISCAQAAGEDPIAFTTTGNTDLRYSGGSFIQNWKTPKTTGCFMVAVTTTQDNLSLTALVKLK